MLPSYSPGSVEPGEEVHKENGLAKEVGQQDGEPNLGMVLQPMEDGSGGQEQAAKHFAQHLHQGTPLLQQHQSS